MFKLELVPKWAWVLLALALLGGVYLGAKHLVDTYNAAIENAATLKSANDSLLFVNNNINNELISQIDDRKTVNDMNVKLDTDKQQLAGQIGDISSQLDLEIAKRKSLERAGKLQVCVDPNPGPPPEAALTWKAYCKASKDPKCSTGS
jgi:hypothetical protein